MDAAFRSLQTEADEFTGWLGRGRSSSAEDVILYAVQDPTFTTHAVGMNIHDTQPSELMGEVLKYTAVLAKQLAEERSMTVAELLPTLQGEPEFYRDPPFDS